MRLLLSEKLKDYLFEFLDHLGNRGYSDKTCLLYRRNLSHFVNWVEHQESLKELTDLGRDELASYQRHLLLSPSQRTGRPRSTATRNHFISALRLFFRHLTERGFFLSSPAEVLVSGRTSSKLPQILTLKEMLSLLAAVPVTDVLGQRDRAALEVLYGAGLRVNEFLMLDLQDLCFAESFLRVRHGKGQKQRVLPLTEEALLCLKDYLEYSRPVLATGKRGGKKRDLRKHAQALWLSQEGARWSAASVREALTKYGKKAGIKKKVYPHLLRHSCATHLLQGRADIRHIQILLGHEKLSTTQKYTHLNHKDLQDCINRHHPRSLFGS